jgi:hypothetical protein
MKIRNIKRRWLELREKHEQEDIEFIRKHPIVFKLLVVFFMGALILGSIIGIWIEPSFILFVIIVILPFIIITGKDFNKLYKKAYGRRLL